MRLLLSLFLLTTFVTVTVCYVIAYVNGDIHYGHCMVSAAIGVDPGRVIGSFGVSLSSSLLAVIFVGRYLMSSITNNLVAEPLKDYMFVKLLSPLGLSLSLLGCLGMIGVGAVSVIKAKTVHGWVMVITFISLLSGICAFSLEELLLRKISLASRRLIYLRVFLAISSVLMTLAMFWAILFGEAAIGRDNKGFLSALFENIVLLLICLYIATFYNDFGKVKFTFLASLKSNNNWHTL